MKKEDSRVFPASRAGHLDNWLRRFIFPPEKILKGHVGPGDVVLDIGCGPGMFSREMARMAGENGEVIAVDIQEDMLRMLEEKSRKEGLLPRIRLHRAEPDSLALPDRERITFAIAFYVVHEVPDIRKLFAEVSGLLTEGGRFLVVEPKFVVSAKDFRETVEAARVAGFTVAVTPRVLLSRAVLLEKAGKK